MNATHEQWRAVIGWEGLYEVSSLGRVRSLDRMLPHRHAGHLYRKPGRVLKTYKGPPHGYHAVSLSCMRDGVQVRKVRRVHTLVLEAFVGPRQPGYVACHGVSGIDDNSVSNLRWGTQSENIQDVIRDGNNFELNKTHCKNGHPFDKENTYFNPAKQGSRSCRTCVREAGRRYRESGRRKASRNR